MYTSKHEELERKIHVALKEKRYPGTREWYKGDFRELRAVVDRLAKEVERGEPDDGDILASSFDDPSLLGSHYRVR